MLLRIRLAKQSDLDLLLLKCVNNINLSAMARTALQSYVRYHTIPQLHIEVPFVEDISVLPSASVISITISESKEADIISFLQSLRVRSRNAFIKALLRQMYGQALFMAYFQDPSAFYPVVSNETPVANYVPTQMPVIEVPIRKQKKRARPQKQRVEMPQLQTQAEPVSIIPQSAPQKSVANQSTQDDEADAFDLFDSLLS